MTFLLFLASLVVLEYLVHDVGPRARRKSSPFDSRKPVDPVTLANETSTTDLLALGRALGTKTQATDQEQLNRELQAPAEGSPKAN